MKERASSAGRVVLTFGKVLALGGFAGSIVGVLFALLMWNWIRGTAAQKQIEVA